MQQIHPTNHRRRSSIDFSALTSYRIGDNHDHNGKYGHDSSNGSIIGNIVSSRATSIFNLLDPSKESAALHASTHSVDRYNRQQQPIGKSIQERHASLSGSWTPSSASDATATTSYRRANRRNNSGSSRSKGLSRSCIIQRSNSLSSSSTFNSNPNHYFSASDRAHRIAQNARLQDLLTHEVKRSGSVTGAGYKAVLQEFLYSHEVEEEMNRSAFDSKCPPSTIQCRGTNNKKKTKDFRRMLSGYKLVDKSEKNLSSNNGLETNVIGGTNNDNHNGGASSGKSRGFGVGSLVNIGNFTGLRQSNMTASTESTSLSLTASNLSSSVQSAMTCSQYQKMKQQSRRWPRRSTVESYHTHGSYSTMGDSTHSLPPPVQHQQSQGIWGVGIGAAGSSIHNGIGDSTHSMPVNSSQSMWEDISACNRSVVGDINDSYHSMNIAPKRPSDPGELSQDQLEDLRQGRGVGGPTASQAAGKEDKVDDDASLDNVPQDARQLYQPFPNVARSLMFKEVNVDPSLPRDSQDKTKVVSSKKMCSKEVDFGPSSSHPRPSLNERDDEDHDPETIPPSPILHIRHPEDTGREEVVEDSGYKRLDQDEDEKDPPQDLSNGPKIRYDPQIASGVASMPMVMAMMLGDSSQSQEDEDEDVEAILGDAKEDTTENLLGIASNDSFCAVKSFDVTEDDEEVHQEENIVSCPKVMALMLGESQDNDSNEGGIDASNRFCLAEESYKASLLGGETPNEDVVGQEAIRRESGSVDSNGIDVSNCAVKSFKIESSVSSDLEEKDWNNWLPWPTTADDENGDEMNTSSDDVEANSEKTKLDEDSEDWTANSIHSFQSTTVPDEEEPEQEMAAVEGLGVLDEEDEEESYTDGDEAWLPWPTQIEEEEEEEEEEVEEELPDGVPREISLRRPNRALSILKGVLGHSP